MGIDIVFQGKVNETLDISLKLIMAFGLCFQLPVLLTLMGKAGLATSKGLIQMRRYAIVIILIVAAIVTPPDVMSQLILFFAVYPLYEVSIFLIRRIEKRREAELRAEGLWDDETDGEADRGQGVTDPLDRIAAALERLAPLPAACAGLCGRGLCLAYRPGPAGPGGPRRTRRYRASDRREPGAGYAVGEHPPFRPRPAREQRASLGRAGDGEVQSLVKAVHAAVRAEGHDLKIVELSREDLPSVQRLLSHLRAAAPVPPCSATTCLSAMTTSITNR